jgi:hypothetical protein
MNFRLGWIPAILKKQTNKQKNQTPLTFGRLQGLSKSFIKNSFFFFFAVLGLELRAFTLSHSTSPIFVIRFFEIGSGELFAWAGFEP